MDGFKKENCQGQKPYQYVMLGAPSPLHSYRRDSIPHNATVSAFSSEVNLSMRLFNPAECREPCSTYDTMQLMKHSKPA